MMCVGCLKKRIADNVHRLASLQVDSEDYVNLKAVINSDRKRLVEYLNSVKNG